MISIVFLFFELEHELKLEQGFAQRPQVQIFQYVFDEVFGWCLLVLFSEVMRGRIENNMEQVLSTSAQRGL